MTPPTQKSTPRPRKYTRPDQAGTHRVQFDRNKKIIYATQSTCGICGGEVDFSLRYPNPLAPCIDHIVPIAKGGHPSDMGNLQLAHWVCNRQKSDKLFSDATFGENNRNFPQSLDWAAYRSEEGA